MTDLNSLVDAISNASGTPALRRRMGKVTAVNSNYTISVQIAGSTTTITGVRYFAHFAPKVNSQVWLDTDGQDWIAIGAVAGLGGQVPSCKVYRTADLNVATGSTWTTVAWQTVDFDPYGMWNSGTGVYARITGRYLIEHQAQWTANATSYRGSRVMLNGATPLNLCQTDSTGTALFSHQGSVIVNLVSGDYVQMQVRQNSGGTLALNSTSISESHMTVTYLGPDA
jgi:hypothetical protein